MLMCASMWIVSIAGLLFSALPLCQMYTFHIEPLQPTVEEGERVILICQVDNTIKDEEYILIWEKDGVMVAQEHSILGPTVQPGHRIEADLFPYTKGRGFMYLLKINPVKLEDAGEYSCSAKESMKVQRTSSQRAILLVIQVPGSQYPKCLSEIDDSGIPEGEEVTITCVSELVTPSVTLQWRRNEQSIPSIIIKDVKEGLLKAHYTFTPTSDDSGSEFVCDMTSSAITSSLRQCEISPLVVLLKPVIRIRSPKVVYVGKESVFICESLENPRSTTYEWTFSSQLSEKVIIDDVTYQILRLVEPSYDDEGCQITCMATNSIGTSSSSVTLHVRKETDDDQHATEELIYDSDGIYDHNERDFLGVPMSIAILGLSGVIIFFLFLTITPVCYCCLCGRRMSSKESIAQPDDYFVPKDSRILPQVPTSDDLAPWMRSVASQVPDDWDVEYSEIGGRPPPLKIAKCSCV